MTWHVNWTKKIIKQYEQDDSIGEGLIKSKNTKIKLLIDLIFWEYGLYNEYGLFKIKNKTNFLIPSFTFQTNINDQHSSWKRMKEGRENEYELFLHVISYSISIKCRVIPAWIVPFW